MTLTLVTGGTGFLGRHLVGALCAAGRPVRVLARPTSDMDGLDGLDGVEIVRGDVTSRADMQRVLEGVSRVFHLAAETRDGQPDEHYRAVNSTAVEVLLELAHERGVERLVHTSSYFAIGRTGPPRMSDEHVADEYWTHDPGDMHDAHEESKYDAEHAVNQRVSLSEPVLALIPTMVYGPERRRIARPADLSPGTRIVRLLAEHAAGRVASLPGDGRQLWNLVHVEDVVAGHLAAMDGAPPGAAWPPPGWGHWHYILGGENVRVADLFERFGRLSGVAPPGPTRSGGFFGRLLRGGEAARGRAAMDAHNWAYTSAMATRDFGYHGRSLDEGLAPTVEWMRECGWIGSAGSLSARTASKP
jgi:dihydroflavonol-4-reductase